MRTGLCLYIIVKAPILRLKNTLSFLQGFGTTSQKTGTTILLGLPGAHSHRAACPESGLCNARVHTVRVGKQSYKANFPCHDVILRRKHEIHSVVLEIFLLFFVLNQWSASVWRFLAHSWLGWRPPLPVPVWSICMLETTQTFHNWYYNKW